MRCLGMIEAREQPSDHCRPRPRNARNERRTLPEADRQRAAPSQGPERMLLAMNRRAVAHSIAKEEQQPVRYQEEGGDQRRSEQAADQLLESEADNDGRQGGDNDQREQVPRLGRRCAVSGAKSEEALDDEQPVAPEIQ